MKDYVRPCIDKQKSDHIVLKTILNPRKKKSLLENNLLISKKTL